jgi:F0F1-type ATP synthase membrane subunit c/vacuolar-type H+-ATPase subunit K
MEFFATTWWIWLIASVIWAGAAAKSVFSFPDKPERSAKIFIGSMIVFAVCSLFWIVGLIAAFIGYAKG